MRTHQLPGILTGTDGWTFRHIAECPSSAQFQGGCNGDSFGCTDSLELGCQVFDGAFAQHIQDVMDRTEYQLGELDGCFGGVALSDEDG